MDSHGLCRCAGGLGGSMNTNLYWKIWKMRSFRKRSKRLLGNPFSMRNLCHRIWHLRLQDCNLTCFLNPPRCYRILYQRLSHLYNQILSHFHRLLHTLCHPMPLEVALIIIMNYSSKPIILIEDRVPFVRIATRLLVGKLSKDLSCCEPLLHSALCGH